MNLLSKLLLDGPNAPLYAALIDSNIGLDYAPGTGFDYSARYTSTKIFDPYLCTFTERHHSPLASTVSPRRI